MPNDWLSIFTKGSAWNYDARRKRYYLHQFAPQQPDLDWWNEDVRNEFDDILRFWFDRGVRGLRIDVAHALIKDRELRDGVEHMRDRPEVHEIYARWQEVASAYEPKPTLMGETYVPLERLAAYRQHLDLAQNFEFLRSAFTIDELRPIVEQTMAELPAGRQACWFGSNHDHSRMATRWAGGDPAKHRAALFLVLTLPGVAICSTRATSWGSRTASSRRTACSTSPIRRATRSGRRFRGRGAVRSGATRGCRSSTRRGTSRTRTTTRARCSTTPASSSARAGSSATAYETLPSPQGVWAYRRGASTCALNMTAKQQTYEGTALSPWEGAIF